MFSSSNYQNHILTKQSASYLTNIDLQKYMQYFNISCSMFLDVLYLKYCMPSKQKIQLGKPYCCWIQLAKLWLYYIRSNHTPYPCLSSQAFKINFFIWIMFFIKIHYILLSVNTKLRIRVFAKWLLVRYALHFLPHIYQITNKQDCSTATAPFRCLFKLQTKRKYTFEVIDKHHLQLKPTHFALA